MNPPNPHKQMIVRLPNWVGDVVMALPTIEALIDNDIKLICLGKPWAKDLLSGFDLDFLSTTGKIWTDKQIIKETAGQNMILLTNSLSSAISARLAGKSIIGYQKDARRFILTCSLKKQDGLHEVDYFLNLARYAVSYWFPNLSWKHPLQVKLHLPIPSSAHQRAGIALRSIIAKEAFWVMCPFAHGRGKNGQPKIWPHWHDLIENISHQNIIICPGPGESADAFKKYSHVFVLENLNLLEYAAVMDKASLVIANDSGPMHLAASTNTKTIGLFGVSDPQRVRPWGAQYLGDAGCWPSVQEVLGMCR